MNQAAIESALKDLAAPQRRLGSITLAAIAGTAAVFLWTGLPLLSLLFVSPGKAAEPVPAEKLTKKQGEFNTLLATSGESIVNRAPWGLVSVGKSKPSGPKGPQIASKYAGPAIVGMINDAVWFADGKRVKVGESSEGSMGVTVLSITAPWNAKVRWGGAEFTVSLFERDPLKWTRPLNEWNGPPPVAAAPPTPPVDPAKAGAAPPGGAPVAGGAPPAPGAPQAIPGGIQLPPGMTLPAGVPIITKTEGGSTIVIGGAPSATPAPPPPPPPDEQPEK